MASPSWVNPGFTGGWCGRHEHCHTLLFDELSHSPVIIMFCWWISSAWGLSSTHLPWEKGQSVGETVDIRNDGGQ